MSNQPSADYGGFGAILAEARAIDAELRERDMTGCPVCGLLLDENEAGAVNCRMGHWSAAVRPKVSPGG